MKMAAMTAAAATVVMVGVFTLRRVRVEGRSMQPALEPDDRLVVVGRRIGLPPWPPIGSVVALSDPRRPERLLVKRVVAVDRVAGTVDVRGDAPAASTDSRTFGPVPRRALVGRAVYRYGPPGRTGLGPWPPE